MISFAEEHLSPYLCGFRKGYTTEICLIVMIEQWEKALDNRHIAGGVLTDLSKAFECVNHDLLIAKLEAYGLDINVLNLIHSYLSDRKHRTKTNNSFSHWTEIRCGVPQGSILGPLMNDIFLFLSQTKIANYADDNTPYEIENSIRDVISKLENDMRLLTTWFENNYMASNDDECKLIIWHLMMINAN